MTKKDDILTSPAGASIRYEDHIAGLAKGLSILEVFNSNRQRLSITQMAERTNMTRAAARRHLKTLEFLGYIESDGHFFWLTHKVLRFYSAYLSASYLPKVVKPILNELSSKTLLCHSVVLLDGHEVVTIASSYPQGLEKYHVLPYGINTGNRIQAHSTSTGKLLLSALSEQELAQWLDEHTFTRYTQYTITDKEELKKYIEKIRHQDWCMSFQEYELGFTGLSVPVTDGNGKMIAVLNTSALTEQMGMEEVINRSLVPMQEAAKKIKLLL